MRFYTEQEAKDLAKNFNEVFMKDTSLDGFYIVSPLTSEELLTKNTMSMVEFKEKYKLNYGDNTYEEYLEQVNDNLGVMDEFAEQNTYEPDKEPRYPVVILGNNNSNGDDVPDIVNFLELTYLVKHFNDEDAEVIVIDKMKKPFDKNLLDRVADYYGIEAYDFSLYS